MNKQPINIMDPNKIGYTYTKEQVRAIKQRISETTAYENHAGTVVELSLHYASVNKVVTADVASNVNELVQKHITYTPVGASRIVYVSRNTKACVVYVPAQNGTTVPSRKAGIEEESSRSYATSYEHVRWLDQTILKKELDDWTTSTAMICCVGQGSVTMIIDYAKDGYPFLTTETVSTMVSKQSLGMVVRMTKVDYTCLNYYTRPCLSHATAVMYGGQDLQCELRREVLKTLGGPRNEENKYGEDPLKGQREEWAAKQMPLTLAMKSESSAVFVGETESLRAVKHLYRIRNDKNESCLVYGLTMSSSINLKGTMGIQIFYEDLKEYLRVHPVSTLWYSPRFGTLLALVGIENVDVYALPTHMTDFVMEAPEEKSEVMPTTLAQVRKWTLRLYHGVPLPDFTNDICRLGRLTCFCNGMPEYFATQPKAYSVILDLLKLEGPMQQLFSSNTGPRTAHDYVTRKLATKDRQFMEERRGMFNNDSVSPPSAKRIKTGNLQGVIDLASLC